MDLEKNELRKKHRRARKMMLLFSLLSITMTFAGLTMYALVNPAKVMKSDPIPNHNIIFNARFLLFTSELIIKIFYQIKR